MPFQRLPNSLLINVVPPGSQTLSRKILSCFIKTSGHPLIFYWFNYFHLFFLSPYHIKWDSQKLEYTAVSWLPHKVLAVFSILGEILFDIFYGYWGHPVVSLPGGNIDDIFQCVTNLFNIISTWQIAMTLWFRKEKVVQWANSFRHQGFTIAPFVVIISCAICIKVA